MRVLVTNADYANALAAVRSLGRQGIEVYCGSDRKRSQSFYSIYCAKRIVYPPASEKEFAGFIASLAGSEKVDVVLPIGYEENVALSENLAEISKATRAPVAPWESMKVASDKDQTMRLAAKVGVPVPKIYETPEEVDAFPAVVKGTGGSGGVRYVNSREELLRSIRPGTIIQEYVPGQGYGFFALYNKGALRAHFMHRRLREYPVTGGASTAAESVFDEDLRQQGMKLLSALNWHGVAMAEFKKDSRDGRFKLMEINPKFWGSLDLSIASGVDFPYLAAKMAFEGDVEPVLEYKTGVRFRWLLPYDVMHVLARPESSRDFLRDFCDPKTESNIRLDDIGPNAFQAAVTVGSVVKRVASGTLKRPHGSPRGAL